nr:site-2 protease family protein [Candidatus Gracilibacteria bacterium]
MFLGILVSIIMFSLIVLVHEFGHFKTARIFGVKVYEFGLGIPPKAKKIWQDKKGTIYTLNWLPIGGFVRLKGESINYFMIYDENKNLYKQEDLGKVLKSSKIIFDKLGNKISNSDRSELLAKINENNDKDNLINKSYWQQSIVILAGVFMNFLLAIFIFSILFFVGVKPIGINDKLDTNLDIKFFPTINQAINDGLLIKNKGVYLYPLTGSLAEVSGIKDSDLLLKVNNSEVNSPDDVKKIIGSNSNIYIDFEIKRGDNIINIKIKPGIDGKIGSYLAPNIEYNKDFIYKYGIGKSFVVASKEVYNESLLTLKALGILVRKIVVPHTVEEREEAIQNVSGPVGIVSIVNESLKQSITVLFILASLISINLGVFNLLPLPALDGGRFAFMTINEIIRITTGKKGVSPQVEGLIHMSFFVILIFLSIIITYNDILKITNNN